MAATEIEAIIHEYVNLWSADGKIVKELPRGYYHKGSDNISRIFGAQYINSMNTIFKSPDFVIVCADPIKVRVQDVGLLYPIVTFVNARIHFREVEGRKCATAYSSSLSDSLGYLDTHGDDGNLIETKDGELYVVDTEVSSFTDGKEEVLYRFDIGASEHMYQNVRRLREAKRWPELDEVTITVPI